MCGVTSLGLHIYEYINLQCMTSGNFFNHANERKDALVEVLMESNIGCLMNEYYVGYRLCSLFLFSAYCASYPCCCCNMHKNCCTNQLIVNSMLFSYTSSSNANTSKIEFHVVLSLSLRDGIKIFLCAACAMLNSSNS